MENEIYKNAPLKEVVFEIRFPGEPAVECQRDKFYEKIKNIYPAVCVSMAHEGQPMSLSPYKFEREDKTFAVMIALNRIAVSCTKYEGFQMFKEEVKRVFSIFGDLFKIGKINRTGLRYINIIPIVREKSFIPISNYLNVRIGLPKEVITDFEDLSIFFVSQTKGGSIATRIESVKSQVKQEEAIMLDFDYAKTKDLKFAFIEEYIEESHEHTKYLFDNFITDGYKKVIRGDEVL